MLTRIAPTPSGFLHEGNLVNFALTNRVAGELGLAVALRIDDADHGRVRSEYVDDIFRALDWLGITPTVGPPNSEVLAARDSQRHRLATYWTALERLEAAGLPLFACTCSRTYLADGRCIRGCSGDLSSYTPGVTRVRWRSDDGDVLLWGHQGDDPSYHLVNVVEDSALATTHIVRGEDLQPSTALHLELARHLAPESPVIRYAHHGLVVGTSGAKLSKSQGTAKLHLDATLRSRVAAATDAMLADTLAQLT